MFARSTDRRAKRVTKGGPNCLWAFTPFNGRDRIVRDNPHSGNQHPSVDAEAAAQPKEGQQGWIAFASFNLTDERLVDTGG
jgi:hypothetical protein